MEQNEKADTLKELSEKLEDVNRELLNLKEKKRKNKRRILLILAVIFVFFSIYDGIALLTFLHNLNVENSAVSVIGGADGPTAIFITSKGLPQVSLTVKLIISVIISAVSITALIKHKK